MIVEVLSKGSKERQRDLEFKLKLYSTQGVQDYWILDRQKQEIKVYRREQAMLKLVVTLFAQDVLTTPLLPGFSCLVGELFN